MGLYDQLLAVFDQTEQQILKRVPQEELVRCAVMISGYSEDDPDQIVAALKADPQARADLLKLVRGFSQDQDIQNARELMQSIQPTPLRWVSTVLSVIITTGFFTILILIVWNKSDSTILSNNKELVFLLVGTMTAAFTQVVNFWLGSSKGSSDKTNLLFHQFTKKN